MPLLAPHCALENPQETIATYRHCDVKFQKYAYTQGAVLLVPHAPRSTLEVTDLETMWQFARQHPERIVWCSEFGAGATQERHTHFQAHRRTELGGRLPIELSGCTELLSIPGTSIQVGRIEGYPLPGLIVRTADEGDLACAVHVAAVCLGELHSPANLIATSQQLLIIGRSKEVPTGWGSKRFGSGEISGVLITQEPLDNLTFETMRAALSDVGLTPPAQQAWEERVLHCLARPEARRTLLPARIRLVVLDIEGVLLPAGADAPWDWARLGAVRGLLEGLPLAVVLCSGRQLPFGEALLYDLNLLRPLPEALAARFTVRLGRVVRGWLSIFEGGALFYDPLTRTAFPHPYLGAHPELWTALHEVRQLVEQLCTVTAATLEPGKQFCLSLNPPFGPDGEARVDIAAFATHVTDELATYQRQGLIHVTHSASAVDITPQGISKASAVRWLLETAALAPDEVLGVDDSAAGAEWLKVVGSRATPANGADELRALLHYQSPFPTVAGTLDILQRLAGGGFRPFDRAD